MSLLARVELFAAVVIAVVVVVYAAAESPPAFVSLFDTTRRPTDELVQDMARADEALRRLLPRSGPE